MRPGDLVRFHKWDDLKDINNWSSTPKERIGVLVHHDKLMGYVEILYQGEVVKERAQFAQKAGKKDVEKQLSDHSFPN